MYLFLGHFPPYNWDITTMTMLIKLQNRINRIRSWKKQWKLPLFHPTKKTLQHQSKPLGRNEHSNWATGTNKWHSGAVKAPGRLRHMHTFAQTHHYTHTHTLVFIYISYLTPLWLLRRQPHQFPSLPPVSEVRGEGQGNGHLRIRWHLFPAFALKGRAISGLMDDITQRPLLFISMLHL